MKIKQKYVPADGYCPDFQYIDVYAGRLIRILRRKRRMSGELLGGLTGLSQQQVSRYERGQCSLSLRQVALFASAFGLTPAQFVSELYVLMLSDPGYPSPLTCGYDAFCHSHIK